MAGPQIRQQQRDGFRVIALVSSYNEGDVISPVIEHLVNNGVDVYLLDNRSTDDTVEQASRWLGKGLLEIEVFPRDGDQQYGSAAGRYDWTAILRRKEELARTLEADWFIHYDADEIRESPWGGVTLKDAIRFVDALDYNCIDFRIFEFPPVDNGFRAGMNPASYFTYCRDAKQFDQLQLKAWKARSGPVSLVHYGGHDVEFEGRRVFPIQFLLRHYPIRSQSHGQRKVFEERKKRFAAEERAKTWHQQYDHIKDESHSFLADPETLKPFDLDRARLDTLLRNRDAMARQRDAEMTSAALAAKIGMLEAELQTVTVTHAGREVEHQSTLAARDAQHHQALQHLEAAIADLHRQADESRSRVGALETALAEAGRHAEDAKRQAEDAKRQVEDATRQVDDAKRQVEQSGNALKAILASRTWRWGEPIGRFILTFGFLRKLPGELPSPPATARLTFKHRLLTLLRRAKRRLGTLGAPGRLLVPPVEVCEFWLSHGFKEVILRSRMRLKGASQSQPEAVADTAVAQRKPVLPDISSTGVKLIAFYLPQYHPIPENDHAWGKGFTEWTNVTRARPLFDGHYQPHLPADLGFYDLRVPETREEQARLARSYGIHGFCYYYYWFDRRRLLDRPLDEVVHTGRPVFPFCICWANEPWSRRWDGSESDLIVEQNYDPGFADRFIEDVIPILRDPRYIRVDGRPLLIVYRLDHLPDPAGAATIWREACRREGVGEICLAAMGTFGTTDPRPFGFDVAIEFPPHNLTNVPTIDKTLTGLGEAFTGRIHDYPASAEAELRRRPTYPQFRGLMVSWDNTARRGERAMLFHNATPAAYQHWLEGLLNRARQDSAPHAPFIFINAWNEWAEGTHLEPDQRYGHQYLEATGSALLRHQYAQLFETGFKTQDGATPAVAIVIPVYNHAAVTLACLDSLARHQSRWHFEVIVVDDGSRDLTERLMSSIPGLRYLRSADNQGFISSCNRGAAAASADYLVFLNNDTVVQDGWLDELRGTFDVWPGAGLVGSKLVWPNGRMQECGSLIYRDGSAENYGREGDPADPRYCYARETDYVTGAAVMIPRGLFEKLGHFDTFYAPGYYEDVDLSFKVRQAGLRVVVNPRAVVIHHEGGTAGVDTNAGAKRYQVINHGKFYERWQSTLTDFPERNGQRRIAGRDRRVLVIDWVVPRPDRDSGSVRMAAMLKVLRSLDYHVTFVSRDGSYDAANAAPLERMGIEVLRQPHLGSIEQYLTAEGAEFGHVIVSRRDVATMHMAAVKSLCRDARVIFDTVDLHFLREMRERAVQPGSPVSADFEHNRRQELDLIRMADATLVVSTYERDILNGLLAEADVRVVSNIHESTATPRAFRDRAGLLFVGYFAHTPNADAVRWFVRDVLPLVRLNDPHLRLHVVGSDPPPDILALASDTVQIHGYVPDLEPLFDACRMSVAPLRYGAGVKGKIGQSLALGVPCVTTSIGAEGMGLVDGVNALIADTAADFAAQVERLYQDEALWERLRMGGLHQIEQTMSVNAARDELERLFASR